MVQNSAGKIMQKKANTINICYEFSEQHQLGKIVAKFGRKLLQSTAEKLLQSSAEKSSAEKSSAEKGSAKRIRC